MIHMSYANSCMRWSWPLPSDMWYARIWASSVRTYGMRGSGPLQSTYVIRSDLGHCSLIYGMRGSGPSQSLYVVCANLCHCSPYMSIYEPSQSAYVVCADLGHDSPHMLYARTGAIVARICDKCPYVAAGKHCYILCLLSWSLMGNWYTFRESNSGLSSHWIGVYSKRNKCPPTRSILFPFDSKPLFRRSFLCRNQKEVTKGVSFLNMTFIHPCVVNPHDMSQCMTKPTKWHVRPSKTQISLGIRPVWSESLLALNA